MPRFALFRRFALALVVAFGLFGIVSYAHVIGDDTLAGPEVALEGDYGCPAQYPIAIFPKVPSKVDKNGDGVVCTDDAGTKVVDNTGDANVSVNGHGNFLDEGRREQLDDISFSFHGDTDPD